MARASWFDDKAEHPVIQEQVSKLASFTNALSAASSGGGTS